MVNGEHPCLVELSTGLNWGRLAPLPLILNAFPTLSIRGWRMEQVYDGAEL